MDNKETNEERIPYLEAKGITHDYNRNIRALEKVDFKAYTNEIVGLIGDNGAGKSTLVKIISGVINPTYGEIYVKGEKANFKSSKDAMNKGIETIAQDMNLIETMDIMRNIYCGREECGNFGLLKLNEMRKHAMKILEEKVTIEGIRSPKQIVANLSGGQKQSVAIARAMFFKKKMLLLDEPTSALSVRETHAFLNHLLELKKQGMSLVLVTHNIFHAYKVADRFAVLRHGKKIADVKKEDTTIDDLTELIVGSKLSLDA